MPSSKIKELNQVLKGHAKSYGIELQDNLNPLNHFTKTKLLVESHLKDLLITMKGFKFIETLEVTFEKKTINSKTGERISIYKMAFFNGKAKTITKANDIEPELSMSRKEILNVIDKWISEGLGWTIDTIDHHNLNITTYKPLNGSSYKELPMKLRNPKKGLSFLCCKSSTTKSRNRTVSESTCLVTKKDSRFPFTFLKKSLKIK